MNEDAKPGRCRAKACGFDTASTQLAEAAWRPGRFRAVATLSSLAVLSRKGPDSVCNMASRWNTCFAIGLYGEGAS